MIGPQIERLECGKSDVFSHLGVGAESILVSRTQVLYINSNLSGTSYLTEQLHNLSYLNVETIHLVKWGGVLISTLQMRGLRF